MNSSTVNIKKFAFDKNLISYFLLMIILLSGIRWYVLQKEDIIVSHVANFVGNLSLDLLVSEELADTEILENQDIEKVQKMSFENTINKMIHLLNVKISLNYYKSFSDFNKKGYENDFENLKQAMLQKVRYQKEISIDKSHYMDFFINATQSQDEQAFWQLRINLDDLTALVHAQIRDIIFLLLIAGFLLALVFLYVSSQLKAVNIESDTKRKELISANTALRKEQDEALKNQMELISANEKMEVVNKQMREYTADLEGGRLAMMNMLQDIDEARKAANLANNAKSVFLASMSHEIRTPMNGVLGMIDVCLSTHLTNEQRDYLETAHSSGVVLMSLLNDLLDYSKVEAGKLEIEVVEYDFYRVIQDIGRLFRQRIYEKGLEFVVDIDPAIPTMLLGDNTRIRQIISNLVGNAIKYTQEGCILFKAYVRKTELDNKLVFEIADTGEGMSSEVQSELFKPFTQAGANIKRKKGGSGLGLTISKQLIELMSGRIQVFSEEGEGSIFRVELPLRASSFSLYMFNEKLKRKSLLLMIKNEELRKSLEQSLDAFGIRYRVIQDVFALKSSPIVGWDGCLLDMQFGNAEELVNVMERFKRADENFKVIALVNSLQHDLEAKLKKQETVFIMHKPILIRQLHDVLTDAFNITQNISELEEVERFAGFAQRVNKDIEVLVAEDNIVNQKVARSYLEKIGIKSVTLVDNGQEVLDILIKKHFDIIFMDIQMPVMDGLTATTLIRKNEEGSSQHIPVIALTAHSFIGERKLCFDSGMDDYLGKPIQLDRLIICLEKWASHHVGHEVLKAEFKVEPVAAIEEGEELNIDIDFAFLNQTKDALGDDFKEVVVTFIEDTLEKMNIINQAIASDDKQTVNFYSHQIKSSSGSFGIRHLHELSKQLELLAKTAEYTKELAQEIFSDMASEFEKAKLFLME